MQAFLTLKVLGVVSAVIGPFGSWNECVEHLPDFEKRADHVFNSKEYQEKIKRDLTKEIKRTDIVHECIETNTKPNLDVKVEPPKPASNQ
jgi:hypothetical protein